MKEFIDRVEADGVSVAGTPINRANMMAIQGYQSESIVFKENSIEKTNNFGEKETITFGENSITRTFKGQKTIEKFTRFYENGYATYVSEVM